MITLVDTFNHVALSTHRTLRAAELARRKHLRAVRRHNGANAYLTYAFRGPGGEQIDQEEIDDVRSALDSGR